MSVAALLEGDQASVAKLHCAEVAAWQELLEYVVRERPPLAPAPLVEALLRREDSYSHWTRLASTVCFEIHSEVFSSSSSALRPFRRWLYDGVSAVRPGDSGVMLGARLEQLLTHVADDSPARAVALAADARRVWGEGERLAQVLLLVHRRLAEASRDDEALAAAAEAEALFERAGAAAEVAVARRSRGASLLVLERLDEAFALLDGVMVEKGPLFGGGGAFAMVRGEGKRAQLLQEAASICGWATLTTPEWVRALGGIAEGFSDAKLWERFDQALRTMLTRSARPGEDLEVVLGQAGQRNLRATVTRTEQVARELGVGPVE